MSDDKQDQNDDTEPINILSDSKDSDVNDEVALEDIDLLLQEEDPDFLKQISEIKVDTTGINLSIMDDVIQSINSVDRKKNNLKVHYYNLFSF